MKTPIEKFLLTPTAKREQRLAAGQSREISVPRETPEMMGLKALGLAP